MISVVYWVTNNRSTIRAIQRKFRMTGYMSVSRETLVPDSLTKEEMELLRKCEDMGYIEIRTKMNEP